jgi:hypothetical protein
MVAEIVTTEMEGKIKLVITEYIKRVLKNCETLNGCTTDDHIDCPKCGAHRSIIWNGYSWACQWSKCGFQFPENLMPPSPEELEEIYKARQKERRIREIMEFMRKLDIDLDLEK